MSRGSDNWSCEYYRNGKCIHREDQVIVRKKQPTAWDDLPWAASWARSPTSLAWRTVKRRVCLGFNSPSTFASAFNSSTTASSCSDRVTIFLLSERCERTIVTVTFNVDCDVFRNAETQLLTFDSIFHSKR